jgi:uncharacterized membrane protein YhaH (DUF805 family)
LQGLLTDVATGANLDWPRIRDQIHAEHDRATTTKERETLLAVYKAVADTVERQIRPEDLEKFRKTRSEDYNLLLIKEAATGDQSGNINPQRLATITDREVTAGRMSPDNELHRLAVAGAAVLTSQTKVCRRSAVAPLFAQPTRLLRFCFSFSGRFNRANFWAGYGLAFILTMLPLAFIPNAPNDAAAVIGLWMLLWLISMMAIATKRLHDLNYSALLLLAFFAVLIAMTIMMPVQARQFEGVLPGVALIWLGSKRGVKGANRFGPDPSPIVSAPVRS